MSLRALLPVLGLLLLPATAGAAVPRSAAVVKLRDCSTSPAAAKRSVTVQGRMRTVPGADRLQMRFDLRAQTPERPGFRRLAAPGFGVWNTARSGAARYVYDKRVGGLAAPADYRVLVRFRWLDDAGRSVATARRTSRVCEQPDLRPDLAPRRLTITDGPESRTSRYAVPVRNLGSQDAGPFAVLLTFGAERLLVGNLSELAAGGETEVEVVGPRCAPGETVSVLVDSDNEVEEASEDDNRLDRTCP